MAALPSSWSLKIGHSWLYPLFRWLDKLLAIVLQTLGTAWEPVRVMTAAPLAANTWTLGTNTKTASANGKLTVNGVDLQTGDTFWDKDDAVGLRRGKFIVSDPGSDSTPWIVTRSDDANSSGEYTAGKKLIVSQGSNAGLYVFVTTPFTLNTTTPVVQTQSFVDLFSDQTITGAKSFAASALRVWNGAGTFASRFASLATATRTFTLPDVDMTPAQAAVATGAAVSGGALTADLNGFTGTTAGTTTTVTGGGAVFAANVLAGATITDGLISATIISHSALTATTGTIVTSSPLAAVITATGKAWRIVHTHVQT